jgi:hypothetical protein
MMLPVKGQCHEIVRIFFIIQQLLLVPLDMPRKDFEFCRISMELFILVIGVFTTEETTKIGLKTPLLVLHTAGSQDSPVINSQWSHGYLLY